MIDKLPINWEWIPLGEYVENHDAARVPVSSKEREERQGKYPYYGASGVIDQIDGYTHQGEYLLLGEDGANLLARSKPIAFLAKGKFWVNNHAHVLKCRGEAPNAYLAYYLNRIDLAPYVTGTAQPKLSQAKMNKIPIPVAPLDQQKPIVAEIEKQFSRLDEAVATLKRVKANLKRYKASVLKAAVEGKLTEDWRKQRPSVEPAEKLLERILAERRCRWEEDQLSKFKDKGQELPKNWKAKYKEPAAPHSTKLPPLPKKWCWATFDQTLWHLRSGTAETSRRESTDYPVLKSSAVRHGVIDFGDLNFLRKSQSLRPENFLRRGDFLITRLSGSLDYVGCSAVVKDVACEGIQYPDRVFCGKLVTGTDGIYLCYCFQHSGIRKALEEAAKSTAGHQRISMSDLYPLSLPLPPVAEQQCIVAEVERRLSVIEELEATVEANLMRADRLRQSILSQAFSGGLHT